VVSHRSKEPRGVRPVDDPVIEGEIQRQVLTERHIVVRAADRFLDQGVHAKDGDLWRIDDRIERFDAENTQICHCERSAL